MVCRLLWVSSSLASFISIPTSAPLSHSGAHSRGLGMEMEGSIHTVPSRGRHCHITSYHRQSNTRVDGYIQTEVRWHCVPPEEVNMAWIVLGQRVWKQKSLLSARKSWTVVYWSTGPGQALWLHDFCIPFDFPSLYPE